MPSPFSRIAALAALLPLIGCQGRHSSASSADSHAPGTTTASVPADCHKYPQGAAGVIRTFCDGPAVVTLTIAGAPRTLTGGTCSNAGGIFSLNLGVVSGPDLAGAKPDYFGITVPVASGAFSNAVMGLDLDGKAYALAENSGEVTATGGRFTAKAVGGGPDVVGVFTC
jgi:hypothetical protein